MSAKSDQWDIRVQTEVVFKRVIFREEVTEKEAFERFQNRDFEYYDELEDGESSVKFISAEKY